MTEKYRKKSVTSIQKTVKEQEQPLICRICYCMLGALLMAASLLSIIAYFSYNALDPSFNAVSGGAVHNHMGYAGAVMADIFHQYIGSRAAILILIALFYYGLKLFRLREFKISRTISLFISFPLLMFFFKDGVIGEMVFKICVKHYEGYFTSAIGFYLYLKILSGFIAFACYLYGLDFSWRAFQRIKRRNKAMIVVIGRKYRHSKRKNNTVNRKECAKETIDDDERIEPFIAVPLSRNKETKVKQASRPSTSRARKLTLDILQKYKESNEYDLPKETLEATSIQLENVLLEFGVRGKVVKYRVGPVITLYEFEPAPGIKNTRIINLSHDVARAMGAVSVRISVIPGKTVLGIELPNPKRKTVYLREMFEDSDFYNTKNTLNIALGKDIGGKPVFADLAKMPHLLVAGTTGSGKSVAINTMLLSLLYRLSPQECRFIMIDPKMLELSVYNDIPHLLTPVVTEPGKAVVALKWAVREMEERYRSMSQLGVRNIDSYNRKLQDMLDNGIPLTRSVQVGFDEDNMPVFEEQPLNLDIFPYIVIVVDEMADLMLVAGKEVEGTIQRLAQMARAAGIHLIMATQRPSVDVITGTIKANFPTRISFQVSSKIDSTTILGEKGAEQLLGMGDMLYMPSGLRPPRIHGPYVSDEEVEKATSILRSQGTPDYVDEVIRDIGDNGINMETVDESDELFSHAVEIIRNEGKVSISFIQRKLRIGYNKAASLVEEMEERGIVSKPNPMGKREIL